MGENFTIYCEFDISMFCSKFSTFRIEKQPIVDVTVSRAVMIRGHGVKFFRTCIVCLLQRYWLFTKNFAIFCFQLASRLVSFLPTGPVGVAAL